MDKRVIDFINKYEDLIDANEWEKIYMFTEDEISRRVCGDFTSRLLDANIHPEYYLTKLPKYFLHSSNIEEFIIPDNIISIDYEAFFNCKSLKSVVIPDSVTKIDSSAFEDCTSLTSVTISDSVTTIGTGAFHYCTGLESVSIPRVVWIRDAAFNDCGDKLVINYRGSKDDWKEIYDPRSFLHTYFTVNCTDGKIIKKR